MQEIENFINSFFEAEAESFFKRRTPDIEAFNQQLEKMNSFCIEDLHNSFGMVPLYKPKDEDYYKRWEGKKYPRTRNLNKISLYTNPLYGEIFLIYCSESNPFKDYSEYWDCLFVTKIEGKFKIIKRYYFTDDIDTTSPEKIWFEHHGIRELKFTNIGEYQKSWRYKEPKNCEYSMADYNLNK
ncbi:MAG: hypothetical protein N4A49_09605 [Marinifilaceae bacterium]|jgi:hypothetical protein|nr:hypothetical protein [Marinifilaceae bacterium]